MVSTEITKEQSDIINEVKTEPLKSQLESFAKYLNLPWDDLEEFKKKVKDYEEELTKHLEEESMKSESDKSKLTSTQSYLRNVFHTFNRPITELREDLISQLNFKTLRSTAIQLLNQKGWNDLKDGYGEPVCSWSTLKFLEELTKRLFNLNFSLVPFKKKRSPTQHMCLDVLNHTDEIEYRSVDENIAKYSDNRFEIYYHYLKPQLVFAHINPTSLFKEKRDFDFDSLSKIREKLVFGTFEYVEEVFNCSLFPSANNGNGSNIFLQTVPEINQLVSYAEPMVSKRNPLSIFQMALNQSYRGSDFTIELRGDAIRKKLPSEHSQNICFVYVLNKEKLCDLAQEYFEKQSVNHKTRLKGAIDQKWRKITDVKLAEDDDEKQSYFHKILGNCKLSCKINGTPLCLLTNGYDFIVLRARDYYEKMNETLTKLDSKDLSLFDNWDVTVFKRDDLKYPMIIIIISILLDEYKRCISNSAIPSSRWAMWHLTYGSRDLKKSMDKIKYLISRKLFSTLMYENFSIQDKSKLDDLGFSWSGDPDLKNLNNHGLTESYLDKFIEEVSDTIKESNEWRLIHLKQLHSNLSIQNSSSFSVSEILQDETWYKFIGATTMRSTFNEKTNGVLKIFDVSRMAVLNSLEATFNNDEEITTDFKSLHELYFRSFLKELVVYQMLCKSKDYVPKLFNSGFLYNSDLEFAHSYSKDIDLYENHLIGSGRKLKTEAPFLFMEYVEEVGIKDMIHIDFDKLERQALEDLVEIHNMGIVHCDISIGNVLIKKSENSKIGYRVVFLDFGISCILNEETMRSEKPSHYVKRKRKSDIHELKYVIKHHRDETLKYIGRYASKGLIKKIGS